MNEPKETKEEKKIKKLKAKEKVKEVRAEIKNKGQEERKKRLEEGIPTWKDLIKPYSVVSSVVLAIIVALSLLITGLVSVVVSAILYAILSIANIDLEIVVSIFPVFLASFFLMMLVWIIKSYKVVAAEEMAVKEILGVPVSFCDSGLRFVPWFFKGAKCRLRLFPKKKYNLPYSQRIIYSKSGEYDGVEYGIEQLKVDAMAYINLPRNKNLIKILQSGVPIKDNELEDWTEESVVSSLRVALGNKTWRESTENIDTVKISANDHFTESNAPLIKAGFEKENLQLAIVEIHLPKHLADSLLIYDQQRIKRDAASFEAEENAKLIMGSVVKMYAEAIGKKIEDVQKEIEGKEELKKEFREFAKEIVARKLSIDGKAFTHIKVDGAEGLEKTIFNVIALLRKMSLGDSSSKRHKKEENDEGEEDGDGPTRENMRERLRKNL